MALGGGTFLVQNKRLPGAYINTVSVASASATLSDRGYAALPLEMDWGPQGEIFTAEQGDFLKNSQKLFGYSYTAAALRPMREVFCHAKTVHFFRLGSGGIKASCAFGSAKYPGIRGNALRVVITASESSTEQTPLYDVETFLDTQKVETQEGISTAAELADNDFIVWKDDAVLALTASTPLTGGTNGTVEDGNYQTFLDAVESRTFNALGCTSANDTIKKLFAAFTERMRNDVGKKFQCIGFRYLADDEGVISLKNTVTDEGADPAALIPWVVGVAAGTSVNKSATNMVYDGEYTPDTRYTQTQLEAGIQEGSFIAYLEEAHLTAYAASAPCSAVTTCTVRIPGVIGPKEVTGRAYAVSAASSTRVQATVALPGVIGPKAVSAPALAGSRLANTCETITIKIGGITI